MCVRACVRVCVCVRACVCVCACVCVRGERETERWVGGGGGGGEERERENAVFRADRKACRNPSQQDLAS